MDSLAQLWKTNNHPIAAWPVNLSLGICGKVAGKDKSVTIYFEGGAQQRQEHLELLRSAVDELLNANAPILLKEREEMERWRSYSAELSEVHEAQAKELAQLEDVKALKEKHEKELAAVQDQLKKKYGID
jgi:hypothetical protein